jgi:hypothetical protein
MLLVPEKLLVRPRVDDGLAVADLDDLRREPFDEVPVVRHDDEGPAVILERVEEHVFRIEIEVVRRLVQQQCVGRPKQHAGNSQARALAAGEHARLFVHVVAREQEAAQDVADRGDHVVRGACLEGFVHRQRGVEPRRFVLCEVFHHHLVAGDARAAVGRFLSRQHPHQRRLAGAVRTDKRDAIAALDVEAQVAEHHEVSV